MYSNIIESKYNTIKSQTIVYRELYKAWPVYRQTILTIMLWYGHVIVLHSSDVIILQYY